MLFEELLQLRNIDTLKAIRLVRHQDSRYDVRKLFEIGQLEIYQSLQSKPVFDGVEYVFSLLGIENTQALFVGFYRNLGRRYYAELPDKPNYVYAESLEDGLLWYHLEPLSAFDDLKERLVIKWGSPSSARSWVQGRLDKEVVEIRPQGFVKHFPGYLDFVLSYSELVKLIRNPDTNREWYNKLSSVGGVYLIVDTETGNQYVGSASGKDGIWGRWAFYAQTGHGGNKKLMELLDKKSGSARDLQFTLLRTLPKSLTRKEINEYENMYKVKLGTRAFGLNIN